MSPAPRSVLGPSPMSEDVRSATERLDLAERAAQLDRAPEFPRAEFRALGELRLLGLTVRSADGGRALSPREAASVLYEIAYSSGTTFAKLALQPEFCSLLGELGSEDLRRAYYRPIVEGRRLVGNHVTEPGAGSDAGALTCRADRVGEEYVLRGTKSEAAFAVDAEAAIVYAQVADRGVTAFLVPQDLPGVVRRLAPPDLGERWMRRGEVEYRDVRVPTSHRLGDEGTAFGALKLELTRERLLLAAIYLGVGRASFDEVVRHAGERSAFGRPLRSHEAVGFALVDDWARLDATELYVAHALERLAAGEDVAAEAALAKVQATEAALSAIDHAIQFHGGRGYSSALPHERRYRDVRSGRIAHGTDEVLRRVAAGRLWPSERTGAA